MQDSITASQMSRALRSHEVGPHRRPPDRKSRARGVLKQAFWYHSGLAAIMRNIINSKFVALFSFAALMLALFLPDLWVLVGIDSNVGIDVILFIVMVLFALEFLLLSFLDATYFLGFFFLMDLVGTVSMIFDISFMLGTSHTEPDTFDEDNVRNNLMLLRAARAARVGARAGRLSRLLRILRFIPLLRNPVEASGSNIAKAVSGQLANMLATRVACLTIVLVMVIPAFDVLYFPGVDYGLQTWVERCAFLIDSNMQTAFLGDMRAMVDFYSSKMYGPFRACRGYESNGDFVCTQEVTGWGPDQAAPPRGASEMQVRTSTFMVAFNMHQTAQLQAGLGMLSISFVTFVMVFSGLALSNVVTELAVRPLERMLQTVKDIATSVFKLSAETAEEDEEEDYDIDGSTEMILLEKVVQKLTIIADLQSSNKVQINDEMEDEDIGIINLLQGTNVMEENRRNERRGSSGAPRFRERNVSRFAEDIGIPRDQLESLGLNLLVLNKQQHKSLAISTICGFHDPGDGYVNTPEEEATIQRFVNACEAEYKPNPFHNFAHATDVLHSTARILRAIHSEAFLSDLEQYVLLVAAVAHDLGHPGVNNGFLSEVGDELAVQYNDKSPLENMHCARLYTIVSDQALNVFVNLSRDQYKEARKACIEVILHTDMMGHQHMVKDLHITYQVNSEIFTAKTAAAPGAPAEGEVFSQPEAKTLAMNAILHAADVSNPCRIWEVSQAWAGVVLEEFFRQGDQEKMLGVPVQFLNDRDKLNRPNSQIGFIEFMIAPFFAASIRLWPKLHEYGDRLAENIGHWERLWVTDTSPSEEELQKVQARIRKVQDSLEHARARATA